MDEGTQAIEAVIDAAAPRRRARGPSPELVASAVAVVVIAIVSFGLLSGGTGSGPAASPSPSAVAAASGSPAPSGPTIELADVATCLTIDARLAEDRAALQAELKARLFEPANVATILRSVNADLVAAIQVAARLQSRPATAEIGTTLGATYADLHRAVSDTLDNSIQNAKVYRDAAASISASLARLEALDVVLRALQNGAPPSPSGSAPASVRPGSAPPSATPRPTPVVTPPPPPSPSPSTAPGGSAAPGGIVNPGFEAGVGAPWELVLASGGAATLSADATVHAGGTRSARVDITVAGDERAAVAVRQGGLTVLAGSRYVATIAARAAAPREVRIRIASAAGDTYATRLYTVGPAWQTLTIDSTVFATDANAYLEIDLGRFGDTTWLDDASFAQVAASPS